jgi:tetratricopeptide (TPR) repeat protein
MLLAAAWLWTGSGAGGVAARPAWRMPAGGHPVGLCGALTYERAVLWGDPIALHEATSPRHRESTSASIRRDLLESRPAGEAYQTLLEARPYDRPESLPFFPCICSFFQYTVVAVLYSRNQYSRAEPELRRSIVLGGQYLALRPMAYMLLSRIAAQRGDWPAAATAMQEAIKYQDNVEWRIDLAQMQRHAGDRSAANTTLLQTIQAYPGNQRAAALLAQWQAEDRGGSGNK